MDKWLSISEIVLIIVISVAIEVLKKMWKSSDKYFEEKAKNFATKQDIISITEKTEMVQSEFHKLLGEFDADLKFKYQFYEKQYELLYSKLYQKVCESEGNRFSLFLKNENLDFEEYPIVEYESDNVFEEANKNSDMEGLLNQMEKMISHNHMYASPELVKQVCALKAIEQCACTSDINYDSDAERRIKKNIVQTILRDYCWLRKQLRLEGDDDMEKIEKGKFIWSI